MATHVIRDAELWMDGYRFTGYSNRGSVAGSAELKDHTRFTDVARRRAGGVRNVGLRVGGFWAADEVAATNEPDKPLFDRIAVADVPFTIAPQDGIEGSRVAMFRAATGRYELGEAHGEVIKFGVEAEGSDGAGLLMGTLLANKSVAAGGPTNGTAFNVGAVPAGKKLYAALHVLAVTTSVDVKIQRDTAGFGSPIDHLTFAQKVAIGSEWQVVPTTTTDDWWRVVFTTVGGAPNARFVVALAIF